MKQLHIQSDSVTRAKAAYSQATTRFDLRTQQWVAWGMLVVIMLVYALEMSHQTLLRYDTFKAAAFDLGNMDQVLWNTIHGRPFQFTNQAIDWFGPPTRLALHFEPIILPLSLLYAFGADPRILLIFQTLALVSGALPVFLLTRKYLPEWPLLAGFMALAYLLTPALLGLNIFDFHPVSLATPLLLYAILALTYKRYVWFLIACILAASTKEDVPLAIAMLGLLVLWRYKLPRLGITLMSGGLLWSFLAFFVIIPHFFPGAQHNNFWYRYESLGSTPAVAILNLLIHPWLFFTMFITFERFFYLAGLLRSTGFLSLLAPEWLLPALPSLAVNLLSTDPFLYSGVFHYNAVIIPFILLSAIHGTRRLITIWQGWRGEEGEALRGRYLGNATAVPSRGGGGAGWGGDPCGRRWWRYLWPLPLPHPQAFTAITKAFQIPILVGASLWIRTCLDRLKNLRNVQWQRFSERMEPIAKAVPVLRLQRLVFAWIAFMLALNLVLALSVLNPFWADHPPGSHEQHIQQLLALIPPNASVSAGANLNPHLSDRERLAVFPSPLNTSIQYIIVDLNAVFPEDRTEMASELNQLVASGQFRVLARSDGVVLLVRRSA